MKKLYIALTIILLSFSITAAVINIIFNELDKNKITPSNPQDDEFERKLRELQSKSNKQEGENEI